MKSIIKNSKETIFRDKKKGGLLVLFAIKYQEITGKKLNVNCGKCVERAYMEMSKKYSEKMNKVKVDCDWKLHLKYNGIQIGTNGQPIRNGEMTNKIAKELHDWHPEGDRLFEVMPAPKKAKKVEKKSDK